MKHDHDLGWCGCLSGLRSDRGESLQIAAERLGLSLRRYMRLELALEDFDDDAPQVAAHNSWSLTEQALLRTAAATSRERFNCLAHPEPIQGARRVAPGEVDTLVPARQLLDDLALQLGQPELAVVDEVLDVSTSGIRRVRQHLGVAIEDAATQLTDVFAGKEDTWLVRIAAAELGEPMPGWGLGVIKQRLGVLQAPAAPSSAADAPYECSCELPEVPTEVRGKAPFGVSQRQLQLLESQNTAAEVRYGRQFLRFLHAKESKPVCPCTSWAARLRQELLDLHADGKDLHTTTPDTQQQPPEATDADAGTDADPAVEVTISCPAAPRKSEPKVKPRHLKAATDLVVVFDRDRELKLAAEGYRQLLSEAGLKQLVSDDATYGIRLPAPTTAYTMLLREALCDAGAEVVDVAAAAGVSEAVAHQWLAGDALPWPEAGRAIANLVNDPVLAAACRVSLMHQFDLGDLGDLDAGQTLRIVREGLGLSREQAADLLQFSSTLIRKFELGRAIPTNGQVDHICHAYRVPRSLFDQHEFPDHNKRGGVGKGAGRTASTPPQPAVTSTPAAPACDMRAPLDELPDEILLAVAGAGRNTEVSLPLRESKSGNPYYPVRAFCGDLTVAGDPLQFLAETVVHLDDTQLTPDGDPRLSNKGNPTRQFTGTVVVEGTTHRRPYNCRIHVTVYQRNGQQEVSLVGAAQNLSHWDHDECTCTQQPADTAVDAQQDLFNIASEPSDEPEEEAASPLAFRAPATPPSWPQMLADGRQDRGWSAAELAAEVGVAPQAIVQWEAHQQTPSLRSARQLAAALDLDAATFVAAIHNDKAA